MRSEGYYPAVERANDKVCKPATEKAAGNLLAQTQTPELALDKRKEP